MHAYGHADLQSPDCLYSMSDSPVHTNYAKRRLNATTAHGQAPMSIEWMVTPDRSPTLPFGIWKSVSLLTVSSGEERHA